MIGCNPFNPRKYRAEEDLEKPVKSIVNFGIIQPITLRTKGYSRKRLPAKDFRRMLESKYSSDRKR